MQDRRQLLKTFAALALTGTSLAGCGGGNDETVNGTQVRLVNATSTLTSADLWRDDDRIAAAIALNTGSGYAEVDSGSATFKVSTNGQSVGLDTLSASLSDDTAYTALAWGRAGAVNLTMISDDEDEPDDGYCKLRFFSGADDAGSLDVYLTDATTALTDSSPIAELTDTGEASDWNQVGTGTYRLRVTAAGDTSDLRLDIAEFPIGQDERITLVLQSATSGVLVHAIKVVQRGAVTAYQNTSARLRLVASVASAGRVGLANGDTTLVASLTSPGIGVYQLVAAGSLTPTVTVGGTAVGTTAQTLTAGGDYTMLVYGNAAAPTVSTLFDNNRLPTIDDRAKMRVVNGLVAQSQLTLSLDAVTVATAVAPGAGSEPTHVQTNDEAVIEVYGDAVDPLYSSATTPVSIDDDHVYTVFMLDGASAPVARLARER